MRTTTLPIVLFTAFATSLVAQSTSVAVPAHANQVDGQQSLSMPFGKAGFRTQLLVSANSVAATAGVISGLRFRADRASAPLAATSVPNVTVSLSHCSLGLGGLQTTFANNVTSAATQVFSGAVNLPAQATGYAGPMGWDIVITFPQPYVFTPTQGDLLIDIVGNNAANAPANFYLDAMQGGGSATKFGVAGDNPSFDFLNLVVGASGGRPRDLSPGNTVEFTTTTGWTTPAGVTAIGFDGLPAPFDLGPLGAPTHSVYINPIATVPHSWQGSFIGWYTTAAVAIPNHPAFIGLPLYGQSVCFDPTANALGILTSEAGEVRVGDAFEQFPMQQVNAADPAAATGTLVNFGNISTPEFGAVPVMLEGIFQ
ncbi:MAG: hypothetical protein H6838_03405 [Planctomycetes bacterium]|nr:hypothetical protein [Planctomycetota bacterium]